MLLAIFGCALWYWSGRVVIYGVFVAFAFHARVLLYEEPVLSRVFGADFDSYRERVPRWFPRLTARLARR